MACIFFTFICIFILAKYPSLKYGFDICTDTQPFLLIMPILYLKKRFESRFGGCLGEGSRIVSALVNTKAYQFLEELYLSLLKLTNFNDAEETNLSDDLSTMFDDFTGFKGENQKAIMLLVQLYRNAPSVMEYFRYNLELQVQENELKIFAAEFETNRSRFLENKQYLEEMFGLHDKISAIHKRIRLLTRYVPLLEAKYDVLLQKIHRIRHGESVKTASDALECANCGIDVSGLHYDCGRCELVMYCGKACQAQNWKGPTGHKRFCVPKGARSPCVEPEKTPVKHPCSVCLEELKGPVLKISRAVFRVKLTDANALSVGALKCGHRMHYKCIRDCIALCALRNCPVCGVSV